MRITHLALRDFRNYATLDVEPGQTLTVFVGPNAAGKTNIIEAIQIVTTGGSFRNPHWGELVRWGAGQGSIAMSAESEASSTTVDVVIEADGKRSWRSAGNPKRRTVDATRFVPAVTFTPDDLLFIKGPAERRRSSLDAVGDQLSVTYGSLRREYGRVIRQRNAILKAESDASLVEPWDEQLIRLGSRLYTHRRRLAYRMMETAASVYRSLSDDENLDMRLCDRCGVGAVPLSEDVSQEDVANALRCEIDRRRREEAVRKVSLVGPHRDDLVFEVGGHDARAFASQGQQRTIALAWKWAEVAVIREVLGRTPVLLLDDVMSELDATRRMALTELMQQDVQTFITTTNTNYFEPSLLKSAHVVSVERRR